jgi:hypothetical protein
VSPRRSKPATVNLNLTLDAGALIALQRGDERADALVGRVLTRGGSISIPAGVVGQIWRHPQRQVVIARLLAHALVKVVPLDETYAKAAGQLCALTGTSDVIDASVVLCAHLNNDALILTSDPDDLARLDPEARIVAV